MLRATSPLDEAATAARDRMLALAGPEVRAGEVSGELWREIAAAAVDACDRAQPFPPATPLFTGDELHLRIPADGWRARLLCHWLRAAQRRHRKRAGNRAAHSGPAG